MIATLMGWGLSSRIAKLVAYVALPLLIAGLLWLALYSYGQSRFNAGVAETDAKWEEAKARFDEAAAQSATKADDKATARLDEFKAQVDDEKEKLDEAQRNGSSPIDVLFGS